MLFEIERDCAAYVDVGMGDWCDVANMRFWPIESRIGYSLFEAAGVPGHHRVGQQCQCP